MNRTERATQHMLVNMLMRMAGTDVLYTGQTARPALFARPRPRPGGTDENSPIRNGRLVFNS
jgi:hypothetical protein